MNRRMTPPSTPDPMCPVGLSYGDSKQNRMNRVCRASTAKGIAAAITPSCLRHVPRRLLWRRPDEKFGATFPLAVEARQTQLRAVFNYQVSSCEWPCCGPQTQRPGACSSGVVGCFPLSASGKETRAGPHSSWLESHTQDPDMAELGFRRTEAVWGIGRSKIKIATSRLRWGVCV